MEMGFIVEDDALVGPFLFAHAMAELKVLCCLVLCLARQHKSLVREQMTFLPHHTLGRHMGDSHLDNDMTH